MFISVPGWGRDPKPSQIHFVLAPFGEREASGEGRAELQRLLWVWVLAVLTWSWCPIIPAVLAVISGTPQCQAALGIYPPEPYQCLLSVTRIPGPLWRFGGRSQLTHSFSKDNIPNESGRAGSCWASPAKQAEIRVFALRICSIGPFPLLRLGGSCSPPLFPALTLYYLVCSMPAYECQFVLQLALPYWLPSDCPAKLSEVPITIKVICLIF